jgi:hypothetical protein
MKEYTNKQGQLHRTDGPAIEYEDGSKEWWVDGKRHREDGPACEYDDGTKQWYLNDKRHREDGPACEWDDGTKYWYLNGERVYSDETNNLSQFPNLSELFKRSIIKYELAR